MDSRITTIKNMVEKACFQDTNMFSPKAWIHVCSVAKYAKILAKKLKADQEVVEIAAWLHDYAGILKKEWYPDHHLHGLRLAEQVMKELNYSQKTIDQVKHCIHTHRGSKIVSRETLEAEILASADAVAHYDRVDTLIYLVYAVYKMDLNQGKQWVLAKLNRSYQKLLPEAKEMIKEKYQAIKLVLEL